MKPEIVTIVGSFPPLLGISPYCGALATAMAEITQVEFLSFRKMYPKSLYPLKQQEDPGCRIPHHPGLTVKRGLSWYNPVGWIVSALRIRGSIVHIQWWSLPLAPILITLMVICRIRGIPIVTTVHNVVPHEKQPLYTLAGRVVCVLSQRLIVHSTDNREELKQLFHVAEEKIAVVPHGALDYSPSPVKEKTQARRKIGIADNAPVVLMFGSIRKYKGIDTAIQALSSIKKSFPDAVLLLVGALWIDFSPYREQIERLGLQNNVKTFLSFISEDRVAEFFTSADLVILPYHSFSSQSGVGLSALPFGLPLVVSDIGGLKDLVRDSRSRITPADAAALAARVVEILANPQLKARLAQDSIELSNEFSWPHIARRTYRIYSDITR